MLERDEICLKKDRIKYETEIFGRQAGHYGFGGRDGERLTILEVC